VKIVDSLRFAIFLNLEPLGWKPFHRVSLGVGDHNVYHYRFRGDLKGNRRGVSGPGIGGIRLRYGGGRRYPARCGCVRRGCAGSGYYRSFRRLFTVALVGYVEDLFVGGA
jgi:hypothetical protein